MSPHIAIQSVYNNGIISSRTATYFQTLGGSVASRPALSTMLIQPGLKSSFTMVSLCTCTHSTNLNNLINCFKTASSVHMWQDLGNNNTD